METKIEYRVRPVTRYIVTKYTQEGDLAGSRYIGEYHHEEFAYHVGYALAKADQERLGYPLGDERIIFPSMPENRLPPSHPFPGDQ